MIKDKQTPPNRRRCVDCIHFEPKRYLERDRDHAGRNRKGYIFGCKKRKTRYTPYWVDNLEMHNKYDDMLGCFETVKQLLISGVKITE